MSTIDLYLYALATVAVTFVGFSTLLIVFRQTIGGKLTPYDVYFVLSFMQSGFLVAAGSLLPPLLWVWGFSPEAVWRISSGAVAVPYLVFVATVPRRRRQATGQLLPLFIAIPLALQWVATAALALEALGFAIPPTGASYCSALTLILVSSGLAFLRALHVILPGLTGAPEKHHDVSPHGVRRISKKFAVVSAREAAISPYPYVYMEKDGSTRELHPDERKSLEEEFEGADGNRPYVKKHHDSRDGWGSLAGFCRRDALPADTPVRPAPDINPSAPLGKEGFAKWMKDHGMELEEHADGTATIKKPMQGRRQ